MFRLLRIKYWERIAFNSFTLSRFDKAQDAFEKLLKLAPERRGIRFNLGLTLMSMKHYEEAARYFLEEQARWGDSLPLCMALAEIAYGTGDGIAAKQHYVRALAFNPSIKEHRFCSMRAAICKDEALFAQAMKARSILDHADEMMRQGNFEEAETLFNAVLGLDRTSFHAMNNIGAIRLSKKDYAAARDCFLNADTLVDLPMIKSNLTFLAKQRIV